MPEQSLKIRFLSILGFIIGTLAQAKVPVVIALFDSPQTYQHGQQVLTVLKEKLKNCTTCEIRPYSFFDSHGKVDVAQFEAVLKSLPASTNIIHLSWNISYDKKYDVVIRLLENKINSGVKVVAASGESQNPEEINGEIKDTVMGKVKGVLLVGELNKKGRLPIRAYYGPEIKISHPSLPEHPGSSFTSLIETARIALELAKGK